MFDCAIAMNVAWPGLQGAVQGLAAGSGQRRLRGGREACTRACNPAGAVCYSLNMLMMCLNVGTASRCQTLILLL